MNKLPEIENVDFLYNENLAKYSTIKLEEKSHVAIVRSIEGLKNLGKILINKNINFTYIGLGANQILRHQSNHLYIKTLFNYLENKFDLNENLFFFNGNTTLNILTGLAIKNKLRGWDVFTGIPATLGGAIVMNAGTSLGEIGSIIDSVVILRDFTEIIDHKIKKDDFSYRQNNFLEKNDFILGARLKNLGFQEKIDQKIKDYLDFRTKSQPLSSKNCGCVFKNFSKKIKAGKTIDLLGLKSLDNGTIRVSEKHANFFENYQNANFNDFKEIIAVINAYSERFIGIKFELEVKF